jgi:uridine kinase
LVSDTPTDADAIGKIVEAVRAREAPVGVAVKIVVVDGHGGAGKSSFAARLAAGFGGAPVLHTDDFASWEEPVDWWPRMIAEALKPLAAGRQARFTQSDWGSGSEEVVVQPDEVVILEGVTALRRAFRPFVTYSVWIETPRELCLARGLARDGEGARENWERWLAAEDAYIERERPHERADLVVAGA